MRIGQNIAKSIKYIYMLLISVLSIIPIAWVVISSFKTNDQILNSAISLPTSFNISGYETAFKISPILTSYANSVIVSLASTIVNVFLISMASYVIARFDFKYKNFIIMVLSVSLLMPMVALIHPIYAIVSKIGLYNTKSALILVYSALGLPTTLYIMRSYFLSIPVSIEEAAYIDGSTFIQTYFKIVLPIARPGIATAAVLQFLMAWNEFLYALILTNNKTSRTLPLALNYFKSQFSLNYSAMFAGIVVAIIPSIIIYVLLQEQVVESLTAGSVKG